MLWEIRGAYTRIGWSFCYFLLSLAFGYKPARKPLRLVVREIREREYDPSGFTRY